MTTRLLPLLMLLLFGTSHAHAQSNFLLIGDTTTKWLQSSVCNASWNGCMYDMQYGFSVSGTTTANNEQYYTIREEFWETAEPWPFGTVNPTCDAINNSFILPFSFGIREDSGKVYLLNSNTLQEHMIYDFTAQIGDSVPDPERFDTGLWFEVNEVDSMLIGGAYRKVWTLNGATAQIIDGIGSTGGLVNTIGMILECGHHLDCYSEGNSTLWGIGSGACATEIGHLSIDEKVVAPAVIQYTPNAIDLILDEQLGAFEYFLYDNTGRLVETGKGRSRISIEKGEHNIGLYYVQVSGEYAMQTVQVIIN